MEEHEAQLSFEPLYRSLVDSEKKGFEQCRKQVGAYARGQLNFIREQPGTGRWDMYDLGARDALNALLTYLGSEATQ